MRRAVKWSLRGTIAIVAIVAVTIAIALGLVTTDWGLARLRPVVESAVGSALNGSLEIASIEGSVLSQLTVRGVALYDADGRMIARVERVFVDHDGGALLSSTFHAKTIAIDAPWVRLETYEDGTNNFARLVPPSPPAPEEPSSGPLDFTVRVDAFTLDDGAFLMTSGAETSTVVRGLAVRLDVDAPLPDVRARIERIAASLPEQDLAVELEAKAAFEAGVARVERADVRVDEHALLGVLDARFDPATSDLAARLDLDVPASLVQKVAKDPDLNVSLVATATAGRSGPQWTLALDGRLDRAPLDVTAALATDLSKLSARATLADLAVGELHPLAPVADVDLVATAEGPLDDLALDATATVRDLRHELVSVGEAVLIAKAQGLSGILDAEADATLRDVVLLNPDGSDAPIRAPRAVAWVHVEGEAVHAEVREIEVVTQRVVWRGEGMRVAFDAERRVHLDGVRLVSNAGVLAARGTIDTYAPLAKSRGVEVDVTELRLDTFSRIVPDAPRLGGVVALTARLDRDRLDLAIDGRELSFEDIAPLALDLDVKRVGRSITATVAADGAKLGRLHVDARATTPKDPLDLSTWRRGPLDRIESTSMRLEGVEVEELGRILELPMLRGGRVDAEIVAGPRARRIDGDVTLRDLRLSELDARVDSDLTLRATEEETAAVLVLEMDDRRVADVDARLAVTVEQLEREGVRALEEADGNVQLVLERLTIEQLLAAVASSTAAPTLTGIVTGAAKIDKRGRDLTADVDLHADELRLRPSAPPLDGRITIDLDASRFDTRLWAEGPKGLSIAAHARVDPPSPIVDLEAWKKEPFARIRTVTASVTNAELEAIGTLADVDIPPGTLQVRLRTGRALADTELSLELQRVDVSPQLEPASVALLLTERDGETFADVGLFMDDRPLAEVRASFPRSVRQLAETPPDELEALPLDVHVTPQPFDMTHLFRTEKLRERFTGALAISARIDGLVNAPKIVAGIAVGEGRLGGRDFERLRVDARIEGEKIDARLDALQDDGGTLLATAVLEDDVDVDLVAERFALDFVSELLQATVGTALGFEDAELDAKVKASGEIEAPDVRGDLVLRAKRIAIAPGVPPLEDATVDIDLDGQKLTAKARGLAGGGKVTADANATVFPAEDLAFTADVKTESVRLSAGTTAALASLNIAVKGEQKPEALQIAVELDGGTITLPGDPGGGDLHAIDAMEDVVYVDRAGLAAARMRRRDERLAEKAAVTIARVRTKDAIRVEGEQIRTAVEMNLTITTTPRGPAVDGWVALPRGQLQLIAHEYEIARARVVFDGRIPIDPRLDIVLTKQFTNTEFSVIVTGTSRKPELNFVSDPGVYSRGELMQVFLGGEPGVESEGDTTPAQALGAAAGLLLGPVTQAIRRSLPIDTLKFDLGDDGETPALTVGKWLTESLFLAATLSWNEAGTEPTSEGLLRYRFTGTWVAELRYATPGQSGAAEVLWVKRF